MPRAHGLINRTTMLKSGTIFACAALLSSASEKIADTHIIKYAAEKTNTDPHDLVDAATLSALLWSVSYLPTNGHVGRFLKYSAITLPVLQIIATSKRYVACVNRIPGIKMILGCYNTDCDGLCDSCEPIISLRRLPLECAGNILLSKALMIPALWKKWWPHKKATDKGDDADDDYNCVICMDMKKSMISPFNCAHEICEDCFNGMCTQSGYIVCPICRAMRK